MRTATTTETYQAFGITPSAPWRVLNIKIEPGYRLHVTFMDGLTGFETLAFFQTHRWLDFRGFA